MSSYFPASGNIFGSAPNNLNLSNTGVTPGIYGVGSNKVEINVAIDGRITAISQKSTLRKVTYVNTTPYTLSNDDGTIIVDLVSNSYAQVGPTFTGSPGDRITAGAGGGRAVDISFDGLTVVYGGGLSNTVRIFDWDGVSWIQRGSTLTSTSQFGSAVALSLNKNTVAIGQRLTHSVYVYDWDGVSWVQRGSTIVVSSRWGDVVDISDDGNTIISATDTSIVRVYDWNGVAWVQRGSDIAPDPFSSFGYSLQFTPSGNTFVTSSPSLNPKKKFMFMTGMEQHGRNVDYQWRGQLLSLELMFLLAQVAHVY